MQITSLELKDFGRHAHVKKTDIGSILGLIGPNGSGKSTILAAIEYAFTGRLQDNIGSYVRQEGDGGPKKGYVDIHFLKDGQPGRIYREVKATAAKRILEWGGKTYTKASDLNQILPEIVGADREALSNAIFISQGELDRLLFGTPAERQDMYTRVMGLDYIRERLELVQRRIKSLSEGTEDFTQLKDELRQARREAETTIKELETLLKQTQDHGPRIQGLRKALELMGGLRQTEIELDQALNERNQYLAQYKVAWDDARPTLPDHVLARIDRSPVTLENHGLVGTLESAEEDAEDRVKVLNEKLQDALQRARLETQVRQLSKQVQDLGLAYAKAVGDKNKALAGFQETWGFDHGQAQTKLKEDQTLSWKWDQHHKAEQQRQALEQKLVQKRKELDRVERDLDQLNEDWLKETRTKQDRTQQDLAMLRNQVQLIEQASEHNHTQEQTCPLCDSKMESGWLDQMREALPGLKGRVEELEGQARDLHLDLQKHISLQRDEHSLKEEIETLEQERDQVQVLKPEIEPMSPEQVQKLEQEEASIRDQIAKLSSLTEQYNQAKQDLTQAQTALGQIETISEKELEHLRAQKEQAEADHQKVVKVFKHLNPMEEEYNRHLDRTEGLSDKLSRLTLAFAQYREQNPSEDVGLETDTHQVEALIQSLEAEQKERSRLEGSLTQARKQFDGVMDRRRRLEEREAQDKKRQELIQSMKHLEEALHKNGIPRLYLHHRFGQVAELTMERLAGLGANFTVRPDPDNPINFLFQRLDEPGDVWMDQSKLSGGQRVRLTVAFLLAVQRLIIPDVGFLVLDEPSQHMDEEGVESLKELLQSLNQVLNNTHSQVVICDHNPSLTMAFSCLLKLG